MVYYRNTKFKILLNTTDKDSSVQYTLEDNHDLFLYFTIPIE